MTKLILEQFVYKILTIWGKSYVVFGLIDEKMNHSEKEQPVLGNLPTRVCLLCTYFRWFAKYSTYVNPVCNQINRANILSSICICPFEEPVAITVMPESEGQGAPIIGRSVNPIPTRGGTDSAKPQFFSPPASLQWVKVALLKNVENQTL